MAIRTRTNFSGVYLTTAGTWPDNTTGEISAGDLRAGVLDTWDSFYSQDLLLSGRITTQTGYLATVSGVAATNKANIATVSGLVDGKVPYTGATSDVNLGSYSLLASGLVLPKASGVGIKLDLGSPTFAWKDLTGQIIVRAGGGQAPNLANYRGAGIQEYYFSANDVIDNITFHVPHDYLPGSPMYIHTHWGHNGTNISGLFVIDYYLQYCKGYNQSSQVFNSAINLTQTISGVNSASTHPRWGHFIDEILMTTPGGSASQLDQNLIEVDGLIIAGFKTTTVPTVTGGNGPFIFMVDIHYQTTGVIGTKDKNYPFYT